MASTPWTRRASGATFLSLLLAAPAWAAAPATDADAPEEDPAPPATPPGAAEATAVPVVTPEAAAVLDRMAEFLAKQDDFAVTTETSYDVVQPDGEKLEFGEVRKILVDRPGRLRVDASTRDGRTYGLRFDGRAITVFDVEEEVYSTQAAPCSIDEAVSFFRDDLGMRFPLAELVTTGLPQRLDSLVRAAELVGTAELDGVTYDQVAARGDDVDLQVWVPRTGDPLPGRIVLTYKGEPGQPQYRAMLRDWNLAPTVQDASFAFVPPAGFERIAIVTPAMGPDDAVAVVQGGAP